MDIPAACSASPCPSIAAAALPSPTALAKAAAIAPPFAASPATAGAISAAATASKTTPAALSKAASQTAAQAAEAPTAALPAVSPPSPEAAPLAAFQVTLAPCIGAGCKRQRGLGLLCGLIWRLMTPGCHNAALRCCMSHPGYPAGRPHLPGRPRPRLHRRRCHRIPRHRPVPPLREGSAAAGSNTICFYATMSPLS